MNFRRSAAWRLAFTLIETVVVIALLGLLAGLSLGGIQKLRAMAKRVECQNRMRQLGVATQNFHASHGHYPPGVAFPFARSEVQISSQHSGISWLTALLPHVELDSLWQAAFSAHSADPIGIAPAHYAVAKSPVRVFRCPADARTAGVSVPHPEFQWGLTNFIGVAGTGLELDDGVLHPNLRVTSGGVTDGTSSTLLFGERPTNPYGDTSAWYSGWGALRYIGQVMPVSESWANRFDLGKGECHNVTVFEAGKYDSACHQSHYWSLHSGGANFAFADGSIRFLRYSAVELLPALATRAGGEAVSTPD